VSNEPGSLSERAAAQSAHARSVAPRRTGRPCSRLSEQKWRDAFAAEGERIAVVPQRILVDLLVSATAPLREPAEEPQSLLERP
jgi:hypothetical protein